MSMIWILDKYYQATRGVILITQYLEMLRCNYRLSIFLITQVHYLFILSMRKHNSVMTALTEVAQAFSQDLPDAAHS